jgi:hypothetical protein
MSNNVAFDFDGVIHRTVSKPDKTGQRHPSILFNEIPPNKFDKIIDLIKFYKKHNFNLYIITARTSRDKYIIRHTLDNFGIKNTIIPNNNIITTGDTGGCKNLYLEYYKINYFYDDSINIFVKIKKAKQQHKLKKLKKCYLTNPDDNSIFEINI